MKVDYLQANESYYCSTCKTKKQDKYAVCKTCYEADRKKYIANSILFVFLASSLVGLITGYWNEIDYFIESFEGILIHIGNTYPFFKGFMIAIIPISLLVLVIYHINYGD